MKKMKVVFAHDHIFYKDKNSIYYSKGSLKENVWDRYLNCFDNVEVIARVKELKSTDDIKKISKSSRAEINFNELKSISGLKSLIKNYKYDYKLAENIIVNSDGVIARLPSEIGNLAIRLAIKHNKPYAIEVVGCAWDGLWNYGGIQGKIYAPISYLNTRYKVSKSNNTIYVTNKFLQKRYPNKNYCESCSNVELLSKPDDSIIENRLKRIEINRSINIGLIGSLTTKAKGIDVAIKAMRLVCKYNKDAKLYIVGAGDQDKYNNMIIEYNLQDNVILMGTLESGNKIYEWLDSIDIYIQPSYQEGLPRATIEAMSRGCTVIGSNAGGIPELIPQEFIHKKGDYKKLSELINTYTDNITKRKEMAQINYNESKKYNKRILDEKRYNFWRLFRDNVIDHNNKVHN